MALVNRCAALVAFLALSAFLAYIVVVEALAGDALLAVLYGAVLTLFGAIAVSYVRELRTELRLRARAVRIARAARPARSGGFPPTYRGWSS